MSVCIMLMENELSGLQQGRMHTSRHLQTIHYFRHRPTFIYTLVLWVVVAMTHQQKDHWKFSQATGY